jgi:hypothetical protein
MSKTFDPARSLVMARFNTVHGHGINPGTPLVIVDEPNEAGQVTEATARRLYNSGAALYAEDYYPTPVETPEQEKARLATEALAETAAAAADEEGAGQDGPAAIENPPADLLKWQEDDAEAGKKAGQTVTVADLHLIAKREDVPGIETDDNKPSLIAKIVQHRAAQAQTAEAVPPTGGTLDQPADNPA